MITLLTNHIHPPPAHVIQDSQGEKHCMVLSLERQASSGSVSVCLEESLSLETLSRSCAAGLGHAITAAQPETPVYAGNTQWLARLERLCAALGASMVTRLLTGEPPTPEEEANTRWLRHPLFLHAGLKTSGSGWHGASSAAKFAAAGPAATGRPSDGTVEHMGAETRRVGWGEDKCCTDSSGCSASLAQGTSISGKVAAVSQGSAGATEQWETTLMEQLCRRPPSREALALSSAMKRAVPEDRGRDQDTNETVWAAAAAVIHQAGLAGEAVKVAQAQLERSGPSSAGGNGETNGGSSGGREAPRISPALIQAWRSAQQVRVWLEGGSVPDRGKTLLAWRASFLLLLKPWASTSGGEHSQDNVSCFISPGGAPSSIGGDGNDVARALIASELVLQFLLNTAGPAIPVAGGSGGGRGGGEGTCEGDPGALLCVLELRSARAMARARGFSLAGRLLDGVASEPSTAEVLRAVSDGLAMALFRRKSVGGEGVPGEAAIWEAGERGSKETNSPLAQHHGGADETVVGEGRLHFLPGVEGCDTQSKAELVEAAASFLSQCSTVLERLSVGFRGSADGSADAVDPMSSTRSRRAVAVHALRAVSMDYGKDDHDILYRSQLLPLVSRLVNDGDHPVAVAASQALQKFYRCVVRSEDAVEDRSAPRRGLASGFVRDGDVDGFGSGHGGAGGGDRGNGLGARAPCGRRSSSPFQLAFFGAILSKVQELAEVECADKLMTTVGNFRPLSLFERPSSMTTATGFDLLEGPLPLRSDQVGMVAPHFPLGTRHTLSMWVFVPPLAGRDEAVHVPPRSSPSHSSVADSTDRLEETGSLARDVATPAMPTTYVVIEGARCVVRCTPSLCSDMVGTLEAEEVIELIPPAARWARHPLVVEGRRVRLTSPLKGYASLYTADGTVLLEPIVARNSRRSANDGNLGVRASRTDTVSPSRDSSGGDEGREGRRRRVPESATAFSGAVTREGHGAEVEMARSNSAEPRLAAPPLSGGENHDEGERGPLGGALSCEREAVSDERLSSIGGVLLFKGNEALLGEDEELCSWNRMGVEVTSGGALRYFVGEGGALEAAVTSADGVVFEARGEGACNSDTKASDGNTSCGWSHLAVVQDSSDVSLFVNGRPCGAGSLSRHLLQPSRPEYRMTVREVESAHPYANSADDFWLVHVPEAASLTVRFDPKSRTEPEFDFVRFYKDNTRIQVLAWPLGL